MGTHQHRVEADTKLRDRKDFQRLEKRVSQKLEDAWYGRTAGRLPKSKITAYHCGRKLQGGKFSLKFVGSGERGGLLAHGPGIYFATDPGMARVYCKYTAEPILYKVELDGNKLYDGSRGDPRWNDALEEITEGLAAERGLKRAPDGGPMHGGGWIGSLFRMVGRDETYKILKRLGIGGAYSALASGYEIAVYDPSIIKIVEATPEAPREEHRGLWASSLVYRIQPKGSKLEGWRSRDMDDNPTEGVFVFESLPELRESVELWRPSELQGVEVLEIRYRGPRTKHPVEHGTLIDPSNAKVVRRLDIDEVLGGRTAAARDLSEAWYGYRTAQLYGKPKPLTDEISYRFKSDGSGGLLSLYTRGRKIGGIVGYWRLHLNDCPDEESELREKYPELGLFVLQVDRAAVIDEYKGKGLGKAMYIAFMAEMFDKNRDPYLFAPDYCGLGFAATSSDARRVWKSLARTFPSSGDVIAVLRRPRVGKTASDDSERRNRMDAARDFPEDLLPNVHKVVPAAMMRQVPYRPGQRTITIYRSVPEGIDEIRPGDWVTLTRSYAKLHGRGKILSMKVPVEHVYWAGTDMNEWFYTPVRSARQARITHPPREIKKYGPMLVRKVDEQLGRVEDALKMLDRLNLGGSDDRKDLLDDFGLWNLDYITSQTKKFRKDELDYWRGLVRENDRRMLGYLVDSLGYAVDGLERMLAGTETFERDVETEWWVENAPDVNKVPALMGEIEEGLSKTLSWVKEGQKRLKAWEDEKRRRDKEPPPHADVEKLYHASVDAKELSRSGFQKEIPEAGGLGGSQATKGGFDKRGVSFTSDFYVAKEIARSLKEASLIARGKVKGTDVYEWARSAGVKEKVREIFQHERGYATPKDSADVMHLYNVYLNVAGWEGKRYNPLYVVNFKKFMASMKKVNPNDIGVIVASVDMTNPEITYFSGMHEYRVPVDAILSIDKFIGSKRASDQEELIAAWDGHRA